MALETFKLGIEDTSISLKTLGTVSEERICLHVEEEYISPSLVLSREPLKLPFEGPEHWCLTPTKRWGKRKEGRQKKGREEEKRAL